MEKTGLPRPELEPKPTKEAGDKDTRFVGDHNITEQVIAQPVKKDTK